MGRQARTGQQWVFPSLLWQVLQQNGSDYRMRYQESPPRTYATTPTRSLLPGLQGRICFIGHLGKVHIVLGVESSLQRVRELCILGVRACASALDKENASRHVLLHRRCVVVTRCHARSSSPSNRTDSYVLNADTFVNCHALPNLFSESLQVFFLPAGWLIRKQSCKFRRNIHEISGEFFDGRKFQYDCHLLSAYIRIPDVSHRPFQCTLRQSRQRRSLWLGRRRMKHLSGEGYRDARDGRLRCHIPDRGGEQAIGSQHASYLGQCIRRI
jgi:hypothetical protein